MLEDGSVLFPYAVNSKGRPIRFQRGVAYIVDINGRWRKQRTVPKEPIQDAVVKTVTNECVPVSDAKQAYRNNADEMRIHRHW
ncbi:hypothetical protein D3C72_2356100 [compost metagenome]